jgi:glyoxylase-like metal-dependent hydrolase (beta-lactamase superfamily II)
MRLRIVLKIIVIFAIFLSLVSFISEYVSLPTVFLIILLSILMWTGEYYFLERNYIPKTTNFTLDINSIREMTQTEKYQLPVRLNSLIVAEGEIPGWIVVAGGSPHNFSISFTSFQVVYADKTVIIECPFNKALYDQFCRFEFLGIKGKGFHRENYAILQKAMLEAEHIIATHEHWDHVGGIAQSPNLSKLMQKAVLTKEQINGPTIKMAGFSENAFADYIPLEYDRYHALAPGIVLIKAPGHSVGSQMVYVQLQNGKEFLFIGDIGWNMINVEKLTNHSRAGMLLRHENGKQLGHQLKWLHDNVYLKSDGKINLLTSHDVKQHNEYIHAGIIGSQFECSK